MTTGTVKWFNDDKGYGFISVDGSNEDIFAHYSAIQNDGEGFRTLAEGQRVTFDIANGAKGKNASNIKLLK